LTESTYRSRIPFGPMPDLLAVHCSDPRYQPHFQEFLRELTGVREYALLALPGGAQSLASEGVAEGLRDASRRWLQFLAELLRPQRVILIAHEDCRWYQQPDLAALGGGGRRHQESDLVQASRSLQSLGIGAVERYYARRDGDHVIFEPV
jgi:hypothetical protein